MIARSALHYCTRTFLQQSFDRVPATCDCDAINHRSKLLLRSYELQLYEV
jgi:hypothetical protein